MTLKRERTMKLNRLPVALAVTLAATPALAHTGHGASGFVTGMMHPLTGTDHLMAMVAVGLWAALVAPKFFWVAPAGFMGGMLAGGIAGMGGFTLPAVEPMIAGSIILFGIMAALMVRLPAIAAFGLAAVFGAFHGIAHGAEMPAGIGAAEYAAGFLIATALLHGVGIVAGLASQRMAVARLGRVAGGLVALGGVALVAS